MNKKCVKVEYKFEVGDVVCVFFVIVEVKENEFVLLSIKFSKVVELEYCIVYEDDYLFIFNKLLGMVVYGGSGLYFGVIEVLCVLCF